MSICNFLTKLYLKYAPASYSTQRKTRDFKDEKIVKVLANWIGMS